jgi:hypothetical protein
MHFSRHQTVTAALSLSAIWLLTHRYHGIHHDALFYAVQALAHAAPARFEHDLFFAFGSQDDYTLFTPRSSRSPANGCTGSTWLPVSRSCSHCPGSMATIRCSTMPNPF